MIALPYSNGNAQAPRLYVSTDELLKRYGWAYEPPTAKEPWQRWADHIELENMTLNTWIDLRWGALYTGGGYGK